jgi:hypothetical protein
VVSTGQSPFQPATAATAVAADQSCCWLPAGERRIVLSLAVSSVLLFAVFIKVSETDPSFSVWPAPSRLAHRSRRSVIAVVDKSYSGPDYYFLNEYSVDFTVTKPITLTSITTSIHLPDGSLARTDEGSSVIYKIVKINNAPLSILNDFVKPSKKEKKK